MTREELYKRLDELNGSPARAAELEGALWREVGAERAILMSDMAGFTRLTRERGILYFLCQFRRAAHAAESIIARHRALFSKTAADNIIATFESVRDAMAAASEFATLHFDEVRPCVGVGYGKILQLEDDVFGDEINVTYKLGEDLAQVGEVLVTDSAAKRAEGFTLEGPLTMDLGGVDVRYFRLKT